MNLRTLKYFVAIADAGSFTGAASAIPIAQPALTRQMRDLEVELGVQLLERRPRGVVLTAAGATFYASARRILAEAARVREKLAHSQFSGKAAVTIGAPPTLAGLLLPGLLQTCSHTLEGIELKSREAFTPVLLEWLERGVIDMAIVTNPSGGLGLSFQPLLSEPFALVSNRDMGYGELVQVRQLARIPLLMTSLHRGIVEQQLRILGQTLNVHWEIDSVDAIRQLVCSGHWATIMPISVFKDVAEPARVTVSEISSVQLNRHLALATRADAPTTPAMSLVQELIEGEFDRLSQDGRFSFKASPTPQAPAAELSHSNMGKL
jgi:LysR family nitrogen assimilation transcriptional regulator